MPEDGCVTDFTPALPAIEPLEKTWPHGRTLPAGPCGPCGPCEPCGPVGPGSPLGSSPALKSTRDSEPFTTFANVRQDLRAAEAYFDMPASLGPNARGRVGGTPEPTPETPVPRGGCSRRSGSRICLGSGRGGSLGGSRP